MIVDFKCVFCIVIGDWVRYFVIIVLVFVCCVNCYDICVYVWIFYYVSKVCRLVEDWVIVVNIVNYDGYNCLIRKNWCLIIIRNLVLVKVR